MVELTLDLKHSGPTSADYMAPQINTYSVNFFLQTLGPWSLNEKQYFLIRKEVVVRCSGAAWQEECHIWSPCPASPTHPPCIFRLYYREEGMGDRGKDMQQNTTGRIQDWAIWYALHPLILTNLPRLWSSLLLVHLFLPHCSLPLNFLVMCFDTALWEHPTYFAITFWVSMMVFCTTVKSAVFQMIVNSTEPDWGPLRIQFFA